MKGICFVVLASMMNSYVVVPMALKAGCAAGKSSPIYGVAIPSGYRQWELVAPSHEEGLDELRVILGKPTAMKSYGKQTILFSDGTILAKGGLEARAIGRR
jgi:Cytochrome P460